MTRKIIITLIALVLILVVGGGVWYGINYVSQSKIKVSSGVPQGWETYVSKYGFSVSYPKDWYLKEDEDTKDYYEEGYRPFCINNIDIDHPEVPYPKNEPWISIGFAVIDDISQDIDKSSIPSDPFEKILFLAKKHNLYIGDKNSVIKKLKLDYDGCLIYYHQGNMPDRAMFYLPDKDGLLVISLESDAGTEKLIPIIYSIKKSANKQ